MTSPLEETHDKSKQQFFDALYDLDNEDSDIDTDVSASKSKLRRLQADEDNRPHSEASRTKLNQDRTIPHAIGLPRSVSDTQLVQYNNNTTARAPKHANNLMDLTSDLAVPLIRQQTLPNVRLTTGAVPTTTGKRKRETVLKMMPEAQQIFKGKHFYFFPNNDTHPARRLRIIKALEFGATWQNEWNECITHVIMDKAMDVTILLKFVKLQQISSHISVVNEIYPAECITYRALLDPKLPHFRPQGYVALAEPVQQGPVPGSSAGSTTSLQLKPAGKSVRAIQPETQRTATTPSSTGSALSQIDIEHPLKVMPPPAIVDAASNDELDAAIQQAREMQHIPFDEDEDATSRPTSSSGLPSGNEEAGLTNDRAASTFQQDKYQCMQKHTGTKGENPNTATTAILQQMADHYDKIGDEWRVRAYRKAIATLRNHPTKVTTKEEAQALPFVGGRLAEKIEEIAFTNHLRRLDNARAEPDDQILQTFMGIYGVGFQQASRWVREGYRTMDELVEKANLNDNQRIGINHYEDFNTRVPRAEVEQHGAVVKRTLQALDPALNLIIGGSYRRGSDTSGDIDCVVTHPTKGAAYLREMVLDNLVPLLTKKGFIVAALAETSRKDGSKWHGASCLPGSKIWRRLDFLLVPPEEIGAALIYFTGNDIFNRSLRLLASHKGMRLNQRGLYKDVIRGKGREKLTEGVLVEGRDEKKIFEILGVPWRPPEHRIC